MSICQRYLGAGAVVTKDERRCHCGKQVPPERQHGNRN
jgi:hypothetical protein